MNLKAGAAKVKITPPVGTMMAGYITRNFPAQGVHDDLYVRALVISNPELTLGIVSADLLLVTEDFVTQVRQSATEITGIPPQNLIIAATHTHSGAGGLVDPVFRGGLFMPAMAFFSPYDPGLRSRLVTAFTLSVRDAVLNMQPVQIGIGRALAPGVGANRRSPEGPFDPDVMVLRLADEAGRTIAILLNQACHPTVLGPDNLLFSGDLAGLTCQALEAQEQGLVAIALTGADGDISTRGTRRAATFGEAERLATVLVSAVQKANAGMVMKPDEQLWLRSRHCIFKAAAPLPIEELTRQLGSARRSLENVRASQFSTWSIRQAETAVEGLEYQLQLALKKQPQGPFGVVITAGRIGPAILFAFPVELFTRLGLKLRRKAGIDRTFVICYANDFWGYLPAKEDYSQGGYEVDMAVLDEGAGEEMIKKAYELTEGN
jgi:hypothetical protein